MNLSLHKSTNVFLVFLFQFFLRMCNCEYTKPWNEFIFAQQWPITTCIDHMSKKPHASCNLFRNMTTWGIHGLWPTESGSMGPNFCNTSWAFNEEKIKPIEPMLLKYWPNIFAESPMDSLWSHEWNKHGTCAAQEPSLNSELKYFNAGLELALKWDLVSILGMGGVLPSDNTHYDAADIVKAVTARTKKAPIVDCTYRHSSILGGATAELAQVKICMSRHELRPIDCVAPKRLQAGRSVAHGNCPDKGILYPSSVSTGGVTLRYTPRLVTKHVAAWRRSLADCGSWLCDAFRAIKDLSLLTF